ASRGRRRWARRARAGVVRGWEYKKAPGRCQRTWAPLLPMPIALRARAPGVRLPVAGRPPRRGRPSVDEPEQRRHPLAAADAHRDDAVLGAAAAHLGEEVGGDARAGRAERVTDR